MTTSFFGNYNLISTLALGAMDIMIRRVQQEDENGCGIACVAMVTGKTYPQAKKFFLQRIFLPTDRKPHTRHYQLRRALQKLRIATEKKAFRNWRSIESLSIVPINRRLALGGLRSQRRSTLHP